MKLNISKSDITQIQKATLQENALITSCSINNNMYIATAAISTINMISIENSVKIQTFQIPITPNCMQVTSNRITAIEFFQLPQEMESGLCIAVGLQNGVIYLLNQSGKVLFVFVGFQSLKFSQISAITQITSNFQSKFTTAFLLGFKYQGGIALLTLISLIQSLRAQNEFVLLNSITQIQLNGPTLLINQTPYHTNLSMIAASFTNLAQHIPTHSLTLLENTNVILVNPRPFLTKIVPFSNNVIGELSPPMQIQNQIRMLRSDEIQEGSFVYISGDEFDYLLSQYKGETYCSTYYKARFIVDTLDLSIGYLGGDQIDFPMDGNLVIDKLSDLYSLYGKDYEKQILQGKVDLQKIAKYNYNVPFCQYVISNFPHIIALAADGALLSVRVDLLDVIAVDYHIDYQQGDKITLSIQNQNLYCIQKKEHITKLWKFEVPSLVFQGVQEVEGNLLVIGNCVVQIKNEEDVEIMKL